MLSGKVHGLQTEKVYLMAADFGKADTLAAAAVENGRFPADRPYAVRCACGESGFCGGGRAVALLAGAYDLAGVCHRSGHCHRKRGGVEAAQGVRAHRAGLCDGAIPHPGGIRVGRVPLF